MAARKLYGVVDSPSTMRVLASLFEHGLEFEFVAVDLKSGEHNKEPFLSLNSRAIMRCISHVYPKPGKEQVYMEPKMQGIAATWIDVEDHQFNPPASNLISELVFKPKNGLPADEAVVVEEEAKLARVLDVYEERLIDSKYLGGDKFTSADLTHLPNLYHLMRTPVKRLLEERPRVSAWCAGIMSRPAWTKVEEMVEEAGRK